MAELPEPIGPKVEKMLKANEGKSKDRLTTKIMRDFGLNRNDSERCVDAYRKKKKKLKKIKSHRDAHV